jgi:DHA2 family multidrug resistance protein
MAPMALLPSMLQQLFGYSVVQTGLMMAPRGVGVLVTMAIGPLLMRHIDTRFVIAVGLLVFAYSLRMMSGWSLEIDSWFVISSGFIQGLGMGLVFMPLNALAFATLDQRYRTDGSSLLNLMRSVGQSAGISMVTVFLARNIQQSHSDLAQHVTEKTLPGMNLGQLDQFGVGSDAIFGMIDGMINKQAAMVAYIDDFYLMAWITVLVMPLLLLIQRPKGKIEVVHAE